MKDPKWWEGFFVGISMSPFYKNVVWTVLILKTVQWVVVVYLN